MVNSGNGGKLGYSSLDFEPKIHWILSHVPLWKSTCFRRCCSAHWPGPVNCFAFLTPSDSIKHASNAFLRESACCPLFSRAPQFPPGFCYFEGPQTHPKSRDTKKTRLRELFRKVRANVCLLSVTRVRNPTEIVQKNSLR